MAYAIYEADRKPNGVTFRVKPASASLPEGYVIFVGLTFLGGAYLCVHGLPIGLLVCLVMGAILAFIWLRSNKNRKPSTFFVSLQQIEIGGTALPTSKISRLALRNHMHGRSTETAIAGQRVTMANIGVAASAASRRNWDKKLAYTSWRLDAEMGGKPYTLGSGMDEVTARDLAQAVNEALRGTPGS